MGIYQRPDSPWWWWSVTIEGRRYRGCTETASRQEAQRVERQHRERLKSERGAIRRGEISIETACARYAAEHAAHLPSAPDIARIIESLLAGLGKDKLLSRISADDVARHVATRRRTLADGSVNRELTILRAVMRMAQLRWDVPVATIDWRRQFLLEPAPRSRVLSAEEEDRLFAALRSDFHPLVRFALASGMRLGNVRKLRWSQVDWQAREIRLRVKSRRPGGDTHVVPISGALAAILSAERGRHPEFVFTYTPERARTPETRNVEKLFGDRQPFTRDGWRKAWYAALAKAGINDLRFHDLRHTLATRLYRSTGNLRLVQRALGHKDIATTTRYENSGIEDVRAAMDALSESHVTEPPVTPRRRTAE